MNKPPITPDSSSSVSRKEFLQTGLRSLMASLAEALPELPGLPSAAQAPMPLLRPPGALPEPDFIAACQPGCTDCQSACPRQAILSDAHGYPFIDPSASPCVMCTDVPCTRACPTDALTPLSNSLAIRMGTAIIEVTTCTAFQGSGCRVCFDECPIPDAAIRLTEGLPEILPSSCTGCGVCVYACPTPQAIAIQPFSVQYGQSA